MLRQSNQSTDSQNMNNNFDKTVKIYVRINSSKKGTDFKCQKTITESQLTQVIDNVIRENRLLSNTNVSYLNLQYVLEGHKINKKNTDLISLRQGSIIHILHNDDQNQSEITVTLRYQNSEENVDVSHSIQVTPTQTIEEAIQQEIQLQFNKFFSEISLVYLGTQLLSQKTFKEALIENNSEIIVIDKLKNGDQQEVGFENAEEIQPQFLGIKCNQIKTVQPQQEIQLLGLQMPFNPRLLPQKVKKMLEQNIMANEEEIQYRSRSLPTPNLHSVPSLISLSETQIRLPQTSQSQNQQQKMDEQKNIATRSELESQKNIEEIDIEN